MSNLYRSAINARLAKLPPDIPTTRYPDLEDEEEEEETDSIGDLPGSGLGPPAMQVTIILPCFYHEIVHPFNLKGLLLTL